MKAVDWYTNGWRKFVRRDVLCVVLAIAVVLGLGYLANAESESAESKPTPLESLRDSLTELQTFSTDFELLSIDPVGYIVEQQSGTVRWLRPTHFYWETFTPDKLAIAFHNDALVVVDHLLEQVSYTTLDSVIGTAAFEILMDPTRLNEQDYNVEQMPTGFSILPKDASASYERIVVIFEQDVFDAIEMALQDGSSTVITFVDPAQAPKLTPSDFQITIPEGFDVIGQDPASN